LYDTFKGCLADGDLVDVGGGGVGSGDDLQDRGRFLETPSFVSLCGVCVCVCGTDWLGTQYTLGQSNNDNAT